MKGLLLFGLVCLNYDVVCLCHAKIASLLMESWNKMKRIFKNCLKKYLLNRLVQKYSLLLTSIILLTVAACAFMLLIQLTYQLIHKNNAVSN